MSELHAIGDQLTALEHTHDSNEQTLTDLKLQVHSVSVDVADLLAPVPVVDEVPPTLQEPLTQETDNIGLFTDLFMCDPAELQFATECVLPYAGAFDQGDDAFALLDEADGALFQWLV
jgi:hypothetical protein